MCTLTRVLCRPVVSRNRAQGQCTLIVTAVVAGHIRDRLRLFSARCVERPRSDNVHEFKVDICQCTLASRTEVRRKARSRPSFKSARHEHQLSR
jgi:hypothetical protein